MKDVNDDFQKGFLRIEELLKSICPEIKDRELLIVKQEVRSICSNIILGIGNSINSLTHKIEV